MILCRDLVQRAEVFLGNAFRWLELARLTLRLLTKQLWRPLVDLMSMLAVLGALT